MAEAIALFLCQNPIAIVGSGPIGFSEGCADLLSENCRKIMRRSSGGRISAR